MEVPQLSREQLATLIPICPLLMNWLRNVTHNTADLFQQSYAEDYDNVAIGLDELINTMQNNEDVPYFTLFNICAKFSNTVWANALRLILTQSQPRIIPPEVGSDLVGTIPFLNGATTINEVANIIGPLLDKLPRAHFNALGEFCALLRDTGTNVTFLACLVGPQLLMPNLLINSEKKQGPGALAAAAVMELLIVESESLFGRCASTRVYMPFGEFGNPNIKLDADGMPNRSDAQKEDVRINFKEAADDPNNEIAKRALRAFYDWRDPVKSTSIDVLFSRLKILRIAQGLQVKYGLIPPGWGIILNVMADNERNGRTTPAAGTRPSMPKSPTPSSPGKAGPLDTNFLNRKSISRKNSTALVESEGLKMVIQEVCRSEINYYNTMNTFITSYCDLVQNICEGKEGEAERACLGLSPAEVETLFGKKLRKVKDVSNLLVARLELLTDFQGQIDEDGRGTLGMVIDAFRAVFVKLDALGPYMVSYKQMMKVLIDRREEITKKMKKKKKKKGMNFLEIWELERIKHDNLKLSNIETVLIKPVNRIPLYKTLLKELLKKTDKENHPAHSEVELLLQDVENLGQKIDRQMQSSKANKVLGIE